MKKISALSVSLALLFNASAFAAGAELPAPIAALEKQGFELKGNLKHRATCQAYAMQYQGQGTIVYLTPDKQHAIMGNMVDAGGKTSATRKLRSLSMRRWPKPCGKTLRNTAG